MNKTGMHRPEHTNHMGTWSMAYNRKPNHQRSVVRPNDRRTSHFGISGRPILQESIRRFNNPPGKPESISTISNVSRRILYTIEKDFTPKDRQETQNKRTPEYIDKNRTAQIKKQLTNTPISFITVCQPSGASKIQRF